jgi:hypothetical protein
VNYTGFDFLISGEEREKLIAVNDAAGKVIYA